MHPLRRSLDLRCRSGAVTDRSVACSGRAGGNARLSQAFASPGEELLVARPVARYCSHLLERARSPAGTRVGSDRHARWRSESPSAQAFTGDADSKVGDRTPMKHVVLKPGRLAGSQFYRLRRRLDAYRFAIASRLHAHVLRARGVEVGRGFHCDGPSIRVRGTGRLVIGRSVRFRTLQGNISIVVLEGATLVIGDGVFINSGVSILARSEIEIGENSIVAENAMITDTDLYEIDEGAGVRTKRIRLGRNVWIGRGATVLPGVTIGDHSVVGAAAVVTKPVPARQVVAGNPARLVRELRASDQFKRD
jgi:acetyltransferase-like isoleucine patch superfamily enzyme